MVNNLLSDLTKAGLKDGRLSALSIPCQSAASRSFSLRFLFSGFLLDKKKIKIKKGPEDMSLRHILVWPPHVAEPNERRGVCEKEESVWGSEGSGQSYIMNASASKNTQRNKSHTDIVLLLNTYRRTEAMDICTICWGNIEWRRDLYRLLCLSGKTVSLLSAYRSLEHFLPVVLNAFLLHQILCQLLLWPR